MRETRIEAVLGGLDNFFALVYPLVNGLCEAHEETSDGDYEVSDALVSWLNEGFNGLVGAVVFGLFDEVWWQRVRLTGTDGDMSDMLACERAIGHLVRLSLSETPVERYLPSVVQAVSGDSIALDYALLRVGHVVAWVSVTQALAHLDGGDTAETIVAMSVYCIVKSGGDDVSAIALAEKTEKPIVVPLVKSIVGGRSGVIGGHVVHAQAMRNVGERLIRIVADG